MSQRDHNRSEYIESNENLDTKSYESDDSADSNESDSHHGNTVTLVNTQEYQSLVSMLQRRIVRLQKVQDVYRNKEESGYDGPEMARLRRLIRRLQYKILYCAEAFLRND